VTDEADASRLTLAVALRGTGRLVGLTNLTRIDPASRTAYFGVVIGERDCWGRGLAREALGLMRARAAGMGLRKLLLEVGAGNARAIALYRGAGFRVEGTMAPEEPGEGEDVLIMSYPLEP
jgi:RimJ/RimL family protein N-acetyltransferase